MQFNRKHPGSRAWLCVPLIAAALPACLVWGADPSSGTAKFGQLALSFEPNIGQTAKEVDWMSRSPQYTLFLAGHDAVVKLSGSSVRMNLLGAAKPAASTGEQPEPGKSNYFTGSNPADWHTSVANYGQVHLSQIYPGIDLVYYGTHGRLEYDFKVAPGANPGTIQFRFDGAKASVATNGDLVLPVSGTEREIRFDKPVVYQIKDGSRQTVAGAFKIAKDQQVSFRLGAYDHSRELIIDPQLVFIGTLGAGNYPYSTSANQITVDSSGNIYLIGTTDDPTFPVTSGAYQKVCGPPNTTAAQNAIVYCGGFNGGSSSAFVSKISSDGTTLLYSTYLSGHSGFSDQGTSIAVDATGVAYLLGATGDTDFPTTPDAFQSICQPGQPYGFHASPQPVVEDCVGFFNGGGTEYTVNGPVYFFSKLSSAGSTLIYSSYLGGSLGATPIATALDSAGNWYLYGEAAVLPAASLYTGPTGSGGNVQFPGITSTGYQTVSTAPASKPAVINFAAALSKFSNDGHTLLYGTFLADNVNGYNVFPSSMAVGTNGVVFLGGDSPASQFPTTPGAVKPSCTSVDPSNLFSCTSEDGFVAAIDTTKSGSASLIYSTRIGGSAPGGYSAGSGGNIPNQSITGVAADASNDVYVTGYTYDQTFPVPANGYLNSCNTFNSGNYLNCLSAFVLKLNPTGTKILGGSFLTGPPNYYESSKGYGVKVDSNNLVYLYGTSNDPYESFPLVNDVQSPSQNNEIYVATMSSDLTKLLFSSRIGNSAPNGGNTVQIPFGLALDSANNIYFAGLTYDTNFQTTAGTYSTSASQGTDPHTFFGKISAIPTTPTPTITLVANAENGVATIAPNTWVEIKGTNLGPAGDTRTWGSSDFVGGQLPTNLDGLSVTVNGVPAYVYYISPTQVNILTPTNAISGSVAVQVNDNGAVSAPFMVQAQAAAPSFFIFGGGPYVAAIHANGGFIGPTTLYPGLSTPAQPGETIAIYANGFGPTSTAVVSGSETQSGMLSPLPVVTIGGVQAQVQFAGLVAVGEFQFNVTVPSSLTNGDQPISATYNGLTTQAGTLLTVHQ